MCTVRWWPASHHLHSLAPVGLRVRCFDCDEDIGMLLCATCEAMTHDSTWDEEGDVPHTRIQQVRSSVVNADGSSYSVWCLLERNSWSTSPQRLTRLRKLPMAALYTPTNGNWIATSDSTLRTMDVVHPCAPLRHTTRTAHRTNDHETLVRMVIKLQARWRARVELRKRRKSLMHRKEAMDQVLTDNLVRRKLLRCTPAEWGVILVGVCWLLREIRRGLPQSID